MRGLVSGDKPCPLGPNRGHKEKPQSGVRPGWGFHLLHHVWEARSAGEIDVDWRVELLLCAQSLHHFLLDVGPVSEALQLSHLPLHDTLGGKRLNECSYLIFRLRCDHEGSGESPDDGASSTDLAIFP